MKGACAGLDAAGGRKGLVPAKAAVAAAESSDFHWHIARADRERRMQGNTGFLRHWRWRVRKLHSNSNPILLLASVLNMLAADDEIDSRAQSCKFSQHATSSAAL